MFVSGTKIDKEIKDVVDNVVDTGSGTIDLVDDNEGIQSLREGLVEDESGLGLGSLNGIDEQNNTVAHVQDTLDFSTKVSVTRCVHDVNLDTVTLDGKIFRQNGNSSLSLLIFGVHNTLSGFIGLAFVTEDTRLADEGIDQSGLSVIDVGNNGNVSIIHKRVVRSQKIIVSYRQKRSMQRNRISTSISNPLSIPSH